MKTKLSLLLLSFAVWCSSVIAQPNVGVIAGYTGVSGAYGQAYRRGIELADVGAKATFVYEDDEFLPAKTVSAFRKLVVVDKVSVVLVGDSVTAQAIAPIAMKQKVQMLAWASTDGAFVHNPYGLRLWSSSKKEFSFIGEQLRKLGYKRLALFTSTHPYTTAWAQALKGQFPASVWEDFSTNPDSFQSSIIKAKAGGFDAIGLCLGSGLNGRFAKQHRALRLDIPIFGCNFLESSADIQAAEGALDGVWFTAPKISGEFMNTYISRFGLSDHIVSAAVFHDAALLLTHTTDKPFALEGLQEVNDQGDRHLDFDYQVLRFKGSQIEAHAR